MSRDINELKSIEDDAPSRQGECWMGPAMVQEVCGPAEVWVEARDGVRSHARITIANYEPRYGDQLLVARSEWGSWALAVLSALRPAVATAADGVHAEVVESGDLQVRDGDGRLFFEHRVKEGRSVLRAPTGDLELAAPCGDIALNAAGAVRVHAEDALELGSNESVALQAGGEGNRSALQLNADETALSSSNLRVDAISGRVQMEDFYGEFSTLETRAERLRQWIGLAEVRAGRLIERTRELYREVEGLAQVRANRMRWIAKDSLQFLGRRARLKAEEEVAIDGEHIRLG